MISQKERDNILEKQKPCIIGRYQLIELFLSRVVGKGFPRLILFVMQLLKVEEHDQNPAGLPDIYPSSQVKFTVEPKRKSFGAISLPFFGCPGSPHDCSSRKQDKCYFVQMLYFLSYMKMP